MSTSAQNTFRLRPFSLLSRGSSSQCSRTVLHSIDISGTSPILENVSSNPSTPVRQDELTPARCWIRLSTAREDGLNMSSPSGESAEGMVIASIALDTARVCSAVTPSIERGGKIKFRRSSAQGRRCITRALSSLPPSLSGLGMIATSQGSEFSRFTNLANATWSNFRIARLSAAITLPAPSPSGVEGLGPSTKHTSKKW
mmetsp:Transcript_15847/g.23865  ORF Transcript_15847/g.23865 Transcript_15847/m.23865 type:complete len:200 (-) Transcript_15847:1056-1655(-)